LSDEQLTTFDLENAQWEKGLAEGKKRYEKIRGPHRKKGATRTCGHVNKRQRKRDRR